MEDDLNPQVQPDVQKVIEEAMSRAQQDIAARESLDQAVREPIEQQEIPEELDDPGQHNLKEMASLARMGKATRSFELGGNDITIRSLTQGEELEILSRINRFPATAQAAVYATLCAAISIESVNGEPFFDRMPLGPEDDLYLYKFRKFKNLYPVAINGIMAEVNRLRTEVVEKAAYAKKESA